ncbi:pro-sigmaK processing inhibitor BofA family protein [Effusibacillus pohliae]|uniref:pro-sigmaK processing inhibitor BofA family protein n=1 Tax=Effusibacillus pohliae TaxID=232270 RepID=UPI000372A169|nr:pro-sigmaK processing inhibitor BofA family protein [Effusibacillus pohliae]
MSTLQIVGWVLGGLVAVYLLSRIVREPGASVIGIGKALLFGVIGLFLLNLAGQYIQLHIPINPVTALLAGFLGVPGLAALIVIQLWILA